MFPRKEEKMGAKKLWSILEPTGQPAKIGDLRGYRVAVDLSCWLSELCQNSSSQGEKIPGVKPHIRNLFWRCYHLLRNQVRPVFVLDATWSAAVKGKTMEPRRGVPAARLPSPDRRSRGDHGPIAECKELLDALGLPCVVSSGEAGALCAKLDKDGLVDGCITDDCRIFLYGANTIYRQFNCNKQRAGQMRVFHAAVVEEKLGLNREKLIAVSLLLDGDCSDGSKKSGADAAMSLFGKDGVLPNVNALDRLRSWREDPEGRFSDLEKQQAAPKPTHCSKCNHQGTMILHKAKGCAKCGTRKTCNENGADCDCEYHKLQQHVEDNMLELKVRQAALEDPTFPSQEVIKEYLDPNCQPTSGALQKVEWTRPDFGQLQKYLEETLKLPKMEARQKTNEILVSWALTHSKGNQHRHPLRCMRILKSRIQNSVAVLEVLWEDQGLGDQDLITMEDRETMLKFFPRVVEQFDEDNDSKGQSRRRFNKLNKCRKRIVDFFKSKKKLKFSPGDQDLEPSSSVLPSSDTTSCNVRPVSFTSTLPSASTSTCTTSQVPGSPPLMSADCLVDGSASEFSEFLCAKLPNSSPEKSPAKTTEDEDRFAALKRRGRKRKSYSLDQGNKSAKKLRMSSGIQPGIVDVFKLKSESASASIPVSSPAISTRSKSCSSDFTDGASTCSDLISDDDTETDASMAALSVSSTSATGVSSTSASSVKTEPQTVLPTLRRSPRESVRQKASLRPRVTPSKESRKRLRFSDGSRQQPKINEFMKNTKSSRMSSIRL